MKKKPIFFLLFSAFITCTTAIYGQSDFKYGEVTAELFKTNKYSIDSNAAAVYLFDVGSCYYEGNLAYNLTLVYTRHTRIHLLNKNSFDLATVEIPLYQDGNYREEIENLKATTYNLQNGKVEAISVDKNSVFKDNSGNITVRKFTFPGIKEGSVIDISYKITTPSFQSVRSWLFQSNYPKLWSEYKVSIPDFYEFAILKQGNYPFQTDSAGTSFNNYIFNTRNIQTSTVNYYWAAKNIPALKEESFTTTLGNHILKVEFQLAAVKFPDKPVTTVLQDWYEVADDLLRNENFGMPLTHANNWLSDDVNNITKNYSTDLEKAKAIFNYVRNKVFCTGRYAIMLSQSLKQTYTSAKGNVADINILLGAMLKNAGFEVHPVLLSTRKHGKIFNTYPIMGKFNYVIMQVIVGKNEYLLDASDTNIGFNTLPGECYNGYARIIAKQPAIVNLSADSITETEQTTVFITSSEDKIDAAVSTTYGKIESINIRSKLKLMKPDEYFKGLNETHPAEMKFSNVEVDSADDMNDPVTITYELSESPGTEKMFYLNPVVAKFFKDNPFKQLERSYPVEMPYCMDNIYILNMEVPKGYSVEEMPKSAKVVLNDNEGMFEYIIGESNGKIQLRNHIVLKKANFDADNYESLKEFFAFIITKQNEQIVLRKQ